MSDHDKMMAFGHWLTLKKSQLHDELFQTSVNAQRPPAAIRVKAGHIEAYNQVLEVFTELYKGDVNKFMESYLGRAPDKEESDGATATEA